MTNKTFIQIYNQIKTIADSHAQIKTFGHGQKWDIAVSGTTDYPVFWAVPRGAKTRQGEIGYEFEFIIQDLLQKDYGNLEDGLSDTHQILIDVLATLKHGHYAGIDLKIEEFTAEPFIEGTEDEVVGWTMRVLIWTEWDWNQCVVPTT